MSAYGKMIDSDTLQFTRLLPGPIERVWGYLVESDKRATWLAAGNTELKEGGNIELNFNNGSLSASEKDVAPAAKYKDMPECVSFTGTVTGCKPPTFLSFSWPDENQVSEVFFELEERGDEVFLTLTHKRLTHDLTGVSGGWHTHLDILVDVMNNRQPQPFWKVHNALEQEYRDRLAAH